MKYGNPTYKIMKSIATSPVIREWNRLGAFTALKLMPYPCEETTQQELWHMIDIQNNVDNDRWERIQLYDSKLYEAMVEFLASHGVTATVEEVKGYLDPYEPIVDYLKVFYGRPRPFQTAATYGIPLYPLLTNVTGDGNSAYPSGHTFLALVFRHFYMKSHPELSKDLMQFVLDVKKSREEGGVHYPSDGLFSLKVYKHLAPWIDASSTNYS